MPVSEPTKRVLAFRSGNLCAFPDCLQVLVVEATTDSAALPIGEAAHIAGERLGAARYDVTMTEAQRSSADNLIYLCPTHHTVVDGQPDSFPPAWLLDVKNRHEETIFAATRAAKVEAMSAVGFAELDDVVRALATSPPFANPSFVLTMPEEKMSRNRLGPKTRSKILIGIAKAREVENYFNTPTATQASLAGVVAARFRVEYDALLAQGLIGNDLFDALEVLAVRGRSDRLHQAAALAVVVYLFEKCDLFEP